MKYAVLFLVVVLAGFIGLTNLHAKGKGSSGGYKSYKEGKAIDGDTFRYKGQRYRITKDVYVRTIVKEKEK